MTWLIANTLLQSLWEGAVVALTLALLFCVTRSPRVRYGANCAAMLVLLVMLAVTFSRFVPEDSAHIRPSVASHLPMGTRAVQELSPAPTRDPQPLDYTPWVVRFWIAGVFLFFLRGLTGCLAARRLRLTGVCRAPKQWESRMDLLRAKLCLSRPVLLLESALAEVPVAVGYLRPVVLMPVGLLAGLPTSQVEAILLHELAHIRRHDYLINLLQVCVEGLLFYHPAVWWISRAMRTEREHCCDDAVVCATGGPRDYVKALEVLERRRVNPGLALAVTDGSLVRRIERLLDTRRSRSTAMMPVAATALLAMLTIAAVSAMPHLQTRAAEPVKLPATPVVAVPPATPRVLLAQATPPPARVPRTDPVVVNPPAEPVRYFAVVGDVKNPGQFDLKAPTTLLEALARAGWITPEAAPDLLLTTPGSDAVQKINIQQLQQHWDPALNVVLRGGEVISVPDAPKVWVTGQVGHAQAVPIAKPGDATVLKVIAQAEGLTQYYSDTAYIYRPDEHGVRHEIAVPLKDIMHRKVQDVPLKADDILLIPAEQANPPRTSFPLFYDTRPPVSPWEIKK